MSERIFTMSMTMYLAIVCGIVYGVFEAWYQYTLDHQVKFITYQPDQQYNICGNGTTIDSEEPKTRKINMGNLFTAFEDNVNFSKRLLILIACCTLFLFHMIEAIMNFNKKTVNLHFFLSSYNFNDCQDTEENVTVIPLEDLGEEIENVLQRRILDQRPSTITSSKARRNCNKFCSIMTKLFLSFIGLFFIIALCSLPCFFYVLENPTSIKGIIHRINHCELISNLSI